MSDHTGPKPDPDVPTSRTIEKWAAVAGRWEFGSGTAKYLGPSESNAPLPLGIALGSAPFRDGTLRAAIRLTRQERTTAGVVVGYQSLNAEWLAVQLGAYDRAYAISEYRPGVGWVAIASAGLFKIARIDAIAGPGIIVDDIQRQISEANAIVAEISSRNPDVFYELGYAHALAKPAVLLARREGSSEMPFDIRGYRAIFYDDTMGGKKTVERNLEQHLKAVLGNTVGHSGQLTQR